MVRNFLLVSKTASSASVESNLNDRKNRIFATKCMLVKLDKFLDHITFLVGTLRIAKNLASNSKEAVLEAISEGKSH